LEKRNSWIAEGSKDEVKEIGGKGKKTKRGEGKRTPLTTGQGTPHYRKKTKGCGKESQRN